MKRSILVLVITAVGILASFVDAYYGLLLYVWYGLSSPLELTYGQLEGSRLSLMVGGIVLATTFSQRGKICLANKESILLYAFLLICFCSLAAQAKFSIEYILREMELITKLIVMALLVPVLVDTLPKLRNLVLLIAISGGLLGAYYGLFGLFAGSKQIYGPGRIGDNNGYAVFLTALLPYIFYSGRHIQLKALLRFRGLLTAGVFLCNLLAIGLTFSRGGFLAAGTVCLLLIMRLRSAVARMIGWGLILPSIAFVAITLFQQDTNLWSVPDGAVEEGLIQETLNSYVERVGTLRYNLENEGSALSRMHFWGVALRMTEANPLLGVGLGRYPHEFSKFDDSQGEYGGGRAVHNTPLLVLSETGSLGFICLLTVVLLCLFDHTISRRLLKQIEASEESREISDYVTMLRISICGFFIGGMFVTAFYQEVFWLFFSLSLCVKQVAVTMRNEYAQREADEELPAITK